MSDAVEMGVVASQRGLAGTSPDCPRDWRDLQREMVGVAQGGGPQLSRVTVLWYGSPETNRASAAQVLGLQSAAWALGFMLQSLELQDPDAIDPRSPR